ncbi:MAG: hypothetical protein EXS38_03680 [Opitutus sp.]|nr:hypothetical protein [Opitutus sp.]
MPTCHVRADIPTAIHIIEPKLQTDYADQKVEMKFTVDKEGQAYNIGVTSQNVDPNLAAQLASTIRLWKFEPAGDAENRAMERTVILPVVIAEPVATPKAPAAAASSPHSGTGHFPTRHGAATKVEDRAPPRPTLAVSTQLRVES